VPAYPARGNNAQGSDRAGRRPRSGTVFRPSDAEIASPERPIAVIILPVSAPASVNDAGLRQVDVELQSRGFATFIAELLSPAAMQRGYHRLDIDLLAGRIADVTNSLRQNEPFERLPVGYFGTSTDAAAIAVAAAQSDCPASAIALWGARPELAWNALTLINAPTLFIVENDNFALNLSRNALARLRCEKELAVLRDTRKSRTSPEVALQAARLAADWFDAHLVSRDDGSRHRARVGS
jgi:putative phosphoribosyl transferase